MNLFDIIDFCIPDVYKKEQLTFGYNVNGLKSDITFPNKEDFYNFMKMWKNKDNTLNQIDSIIKKSKLNIKSSNACYYITYASLKECSISLHDITITDTLIAKTKLFL